MRQYSKTVFMEQTHFRTWEYQRTLVDRLISAFQAARFAVTEPTLLRVARMRHEREYANPDEDPLISVVMTTYKRARVLVNRCLPSILDQTYKNFEVVITADSRVDETAALIKKIGDPRIKFFDIPEYEQYPKETKLRWFVGGVPSRNKALELARGKWIAEIDDDDVFLPDHLEMLLRFAQRGEYEFVSACHIVEKNGKRSVVDVKDVRPRIGGVQTWLYRSYLRFFKWNIHSWRKSYNRNPDIERQLRMGFAGARIGFLEKVVTLVLPIPGKETTGLDALTEDRYL